MSFKKGGKKGHLKKSRKKNTLTISEFPDELYYGQVIKISGERRFHIRPLDGSKVAKSYQIRKKAGWCRMDSYVLYTQTEEERRHMNIKKQVCEPVCVIMKVIPDDELETLKKTDTFLKDFFKNDKGGKEAGCCVFYHSDDSDNSDDPDASYFKDLDPELSKDVAKIDLDTI